MGFLRLKLFVFLLFFAVYPNVSDQTLTCGNNNFYIHYPFRLLQEGQNPHHIKSHHHDHQFILKCNSQGFVVLNLPSSGEFYVRDINYLEQKVQIYDPGNCLPGRLKNLSLSSSPFVAETYLNYTFFSCPPESLMISSRNFSVISCLSNSSSAILATSLQSMADEIRNLTGCKMIYSLQIPISLPFQYEYNGFDGDLQLAWNDPNKGRSLSKSVPSVIILWLLIIKLALLGILSCLGCCLLLARLVLAIDMANIRRPNNPNTRVPEMVRITITPPRLQPQPLAPSMTEELIIGGSQCILVSNSDSCPICLGEYKAPERLRLICICKHCFHADCLDKWLQRENTCPICRITVV